MTDSNNSGIYGILNTESGKWYVGQSVNISQRIDQHKTLLRTGVHKNRHLQSAWNKRGEGAFLFVVLECCDVDSLTEREIFWIKEKNSLCGGYNKTKGGEGLRGWNAPEWYRRQRSEMYSGENNPFYGKKHSARTLAKLRETHRGERHVNYGKHLSEETRSKISAAHIGMKHSEETKKKLSEMNKGKPPSANALKKAAEFTSSERNPKCRPVICLTTNERFFSAAEAARVTGIDRSKISACCRGERKSTKGTAWMFAQEPPPDEDGKEE